jgi:nucleotide-binding universal stress UspA family protein/CBS domain-containing protein
MAFPFRTILCPVDFDDSSMDALEMAAGVARQNDSTIIVLHVVPMLIEPTDLPVYINLYKSQEQSARAKLEEIAHKQLAGLNYQLLTEMGEPAAMILRAEKRAAADLVVMATHGRRGFSRLLLGSVAELVLRQSSCPVLTVRHVELQKHLVSAWMTRNPVTATPDEKLSTVRDKLIGGPFHCIPIIRDGLLVGIVTEEDIHAHAGYLDQTEACRVMRDALVTVRPSTTLREAARLLREHQLGGLAVVEEGKLAGVITTADMLGALAAEE